MDRKPEESKRISRRDLLKGAGLAGAAAILPASLAAEVKGAGSAEGALPVALPVVKRRVRFLNLTMEEGEILDAMIARIIPADDLGPGAREAGAINYIDRELGGALASSLQAYRDGLAALDRYAQYTRGARFAELSERDQDSVLIDVQGGSASAAGAGFTGGSGTFFNLVRGHTIQGTFSDPQYGGNQNFIGWDMIRYPGVRRFVTPQDQARMERGELPPNHMSGYDH